MSAGIHKGISVRVQKGTDLEGMFSEDFWPVMRCGVGGRVTAQKCLRDAQNMLEEQIGEAFGDLPF